MVALLEGCKISQTLQPNYQFYHMYAHSPYVGASNQARKLLWRVIAKSSFVVGLAGAGLVAVRFASFMVFMTAIFISTATMRQRRAGQRQAGERQGE
jgi:hypothetical protein